MDPVICLLEFIILQLKAHMDAAGVQSMRYLRLKCIFPCNRERSQEEMHSHRNHFASSILAGGFTRSLWEPCSGDEEPGAEQVGHNYIGP